MNSCEDLAEARGFPIRKSSDQSSFAAPRSLSQRTTSFIASQRQGIHQMPLSRLIALIINAHPLELSGTQNSAASGRTGIEERPVDCARFACRARSGARATSGVPIDDRYTDKSLLHDVNEQDAMRLRRQNIARVEIGCMRLVEPTGIEPATSSLHS